MEDARLSTWEAMGEMLAMKESHPIPKSMHFYPWT